LKASNTDGGDNFGRSVSLEKDLLAVGASLEDSNATGVHGGQDDNSAGKSGAVYLFTRNNGEWSQIAYVKASNSNADDQFGASVAVTAETLAVGAPLEGSSAVGVNSNQADNTASGAGAVYVFE
jgi:hypothetical protein